MVRDMYIVLPKKAHDLTGRSYGRLVVLGPVMVKKYPRVTVIIWRCRCVCGSVTDRSAANLRSGNSRSCGCSKSEFIREAITKHGHTTRRVRSPEYRAWSKMIARCYNPNDGRYVDYGARGIKVCAEWRESFELFLQSIGARPGPSYSVDRIDNNGNYERGNVRWATKTEQSRNRRNIITLDVFGRQVRLADAAEEFGIPRDVVYERLAKGWDACDALLTPKRKQKKRMKKRSRDCVSDAS